MTPTGPVVSSVVLPSHAATSLCGSIIPAPAFKFNVLDAGTEKNINAAATVTISNSEITIKAEKVDTDGSIELIGRVPSPGFYDLIASAPGYRNMRILGVQTLELLIPECNHYYTRTVELVLND